MLDAFIIEKIKEEERRRDERRPVLRLPVYIDDGEWNQVEKEKREIEKDGRQEPMVIDFS